MVVLDGPMNFDLAHQLLFCSAALQRGLLDDFCGCNVFVVALNELVAFCESSLAEELSFDILSIGHFAVCVLQFFFDDLSALILGRVEVGLALACRKSSLPSRASALALCSVANLLVLHQLLVEI